MNQRDEENVLSIKINQLNGDVPMLLTKGEIIYEISEHDLHYQILVEDKPVENWQKINVKKFHKTLFRELVHRVQLLSHEEQDRHYAETRFIISVRYQTHIDCYYYTNTIKEKDLRLWAILERIIGMNKNLAPYFDSDPIDDDKLLTIDPKTIKLFMFTTKPKNKHTLYDELYVLVNDTMLYTPYINTRINSEENCKKIFKELDHIKYKTLKTVFLNGEEFQMMKLRSNRILFFKDELLLILAVELFLSKESERDEVFTKYLLSNTTVPTNVIYREIQ